MDRRNFLSTASATSMAALTGMGGAAVNADERMSTPWLDREQAKSRNQNRSTVVSQNGMVCASQPLATLAGIDVLRSGGNCVDAAIATNAVLGVTEPASNGIGGDLFAILWSEKEQRLFGLNASGRSPKTWNLKAAQEAGLTDSIPRISAYSWNVPGCVGGWAALQQRFGQLKLSDCLAAAIRYAQDGFPLSPIISGHFAGVAQGHATLAPIYNPDGKVPQYGEIFRNPGLARSLRQIADGGADAFYRGEIAEKIVAKSKELGGYMTMSDLADNKPKWVEPVSSSYRDWDVWEIPPNGQGIAALQILNLLEQYDIGSLKPNSAEHLHLFIEAKKLAFEDRAHYYADPDFADVPVDWLISKEYAKRRVKQINLKRANREVPYGDPKLDSDTVYLAAADREGNMISFIQSLYNGFGSSICPDGLGFPIQNRGKAFSLDPSHRNRLEGGKRPFHTIIPAFMTQGGKPVMPFGVMGGDFQPQGHAQIVMNMVDFGMSVQQAGDQPRIAHSGSSHPWGGIMKNGGRVDPEHGIQDSVIASLASRGHEINPNVSAHGGYQAIWREDDPRRYFGGSDPRKDGCAIGY